MSKNFSMEKVWDQALEKIKGKLSQPSFETWLKSTRPVDLKDNNLFIEVPNEFARDWLESRYSELIEDILQNITSSQLQVRFTIHNSPLENNVTQPYRDLHPEGPHSNSGASFLNPKYSFETFVVGDSNRFAHAASLAVAEAPARAYNPLFVYGDVGLGKTHLMQAIGHYTLRQNPDLKVVYVSSETFTNELINSIRDDKTVDFRNKYRNIDILLVDDIQFLAGKERTQEEFFHTFNALHEATRQLVISSDRPPRDIPTLEERLRSRFEWGLITDIQKPDLETRIAILRKKASLERITVPNEVIVFIANQIQSNIRELEGALTRIKAYSSMQNVPITVEMAKEALQDILALAQPRPLSIEDIQEGVARFFSLRPQDMVSKKRTQNIAFPRQIAMYLCRELTDASLPQIGQSFGGRDHTTVIHACSKIVDRLEKDASLRASLTKLQDKLKEK